MIFWIYGQPGSGKTTLAKEVARRLNTQYYFASSHRRAILIDGDDIRDLYSKHTYDRAGRIENINRAQELATFINFSGHDAVVSLVTPLKDIRDKYFKANEGRIVTVYLHSTRSHRHAHFVYDFEYPLSEQVEIDTDEVSVCTASDRVMIQSIEVSMKGLDI